MKKNPYAQAFETQREAASLDKSSVGRGFSKPAVFNDVLDAELHEFEISIPELLQKQLPIKLEDMILRLICTGTNDVIAEEDRHFSTLAFNKYNTAILANCQKVIDLVYNAKYSLSKTSKKNRLFILVYVSTLGDKDIASLALNKAVDLCMDAEDILTLACFIKGMRGWGRMVKKIFSRWYLERDPRDLLGEVLQYPEMELKIDHEKISFTHRNIVRRLHLRGADNLQDACLRIIKGYRGDASEVPMRFLNYSEVIGLDLKAEGSVSTAVDFIEGLPFDEHAYPKDFSNHADIRSSLFYNKNLTAKSFMEDVQSGFAFEYLQNALTPRVVYILEKYIEEEAMTKTDLLRIWHALGDDLSDVSEEVLKLFYRLEKIKLEQDPETTVFAFLGYDDDMNKDIVLNAYVRARELGSTIVLVQHGVFVMDPSSELIENVMKYVPKADKNTNLITSNVLVNILGQQKGKYNTVVIYEGSSYARDKDMVNEFMSVLDTYMTAKNPKMKIVTHQFEDKATSLFLEPRHPGLLTVRGDNTRATQLVDIFLEL